MLGLVDKRTEPAGRQERGFPDPIANYILYLKQLYPPIHYREIVRIVGNKFGTRLIQKQTKSRKKRLNYLTSPIIVTNICSLTSAISSNLKESGFIASAPLKVSRKPADRHGLSLSR